MSEADLFDVWPDNIGMMLTSDNKTDVEKAMAGFIPQLLLRPTSLSEGGYSVSFSVDAIKEYYAFLCKKYEIDDSISSTISDGSDNW